MEDSGNFLDRMRQISMAAGKGEAPTPTDDDDIVQHDAYAVSRGIRPVAMLELRFTNGNCIAFDYGWLGRVDFDPSQGIHLRFERVTVQVKGKLLRPLFDALVRKRLLWIRESDSLVATVATEATTQVTNLILQEFEAK